MVEVRIPEYCSKETTYCIQTLLGDFLGLEFVIKSKLLQSNNDFEFHYNGKFIIVSNHFFDTDDAASLYVRENLPIEVTLETVIVDGEVYDAAVLYGSSKCEILENGYKLDLDIISSSFYMLSRWEEALPGNKDLHGRFCAKESLAAKFKFISRPIVNEYVELLWSLLLSIGYNRKCRKPRNFSIIPTHDVDRPYKWNSLFGFIKCQLKNFKWQRWHDIVVDIKMFLRGHDPYDTFDYLMTKAENRAVKAYFFFMAGGTTGYDDFYKLTEKRVLRLIEEIKRRGHYIGLHPSYDSMKKITLIDAEKRTLEEVIDLDVYSSRQHYLRFEVPTTWNFLEELGFRWDTTMTYSGLTGFRCGVCYPFPVFDIVGRRKLELVERPLVVMETTLLINQSLTTQEIISNIGLLKNNVRKYDGDFIFLWHNSSFNKKAYVNAKEIIETIYNE